jgi:4-amino-4-deoxy-L-arabinose transferase-like glycosyltransferase
MPGFLPGQGTLRSLLPLLLTGLLAGGALCYRLDGYALLEPDEGRNAEVAREMAASNNYVLPRLNGLPYVDKPALYYAAGALAMEILGPTETAARLPSVVFTLLTLGVVAWFAHRLYGARGAWTAGIAYVASPFTVAYARTVIMDSAVTLWMTGAIVALWMAVEAGGNGRREPGNARSTGWRWAALGWGVIGLGVLTKGPIALAVPLLVVVPFALWRRRLGAVFDPLGLLLFLAVVLPWVFAVSRQVPDFLHYAMVVETGQRLATGALGRTESWWYFFPIVLGAALPWSVVALFGLRRRPPGTPWDPRAVLLFCWIAVPLLFFTLSQSKRPQYVLPLVPAWALAVAHVWRRDAGPAPGARVAGGMLAALGLQLVLGAGLLARLFPATPETAALIAPTARGVGALAMAGGLAALFLPARRHWALLGLALPALGLPVAGMPLLRAIGRDRSSAEIAAAMRPFLTDRTEIVTVGAYPLSLPFYLQRTFALATADGRELTSNYVPRRHDLLRLVPGSPLRPPDWWEEALTFCGRPRMFVARTDARAVRERLAATLPLVAVSRKFAVYGPCGGETLVAGPPRLVPLSRRPHPLSPSPFGRGGTSHRLPDAWGTTSAPLSAGGEDGGTGGEDERPARAN